SKNSSNTGRNSRRAYVQEEVVEGINAPNETRNVQRTLRTPSLGNTSIVQCYNCSGKGHYARNSDNTSDAGPSYDSAFISEVQSSSSNENKEQMNVNSGSIEKDTHVPDLCALEQLARNAYQEAEKQ
ncbi:hypothetical protein Tco_0230407, partial [Tanacetum coccineum]